MVLSKRKKTICSSQHKKHALWILALCLFCALLLGWLDFKHTKHSSRSHNRSHHGHKKRSAILSESLNLKNWKWTNWNNWRNSNYYGIVRRWGGAQRGRGIFKFSINDNAKAIKVKVKKVNISDHVNRHQREVREGDMYQLVQKNCSIPFVPRHSPTYKKLNLDKVLHPLLDDCSHVPDFSRLDPQSGRLILTDPSLRVTDCCVREIKRPFAHPPDKFKYAVGQECRMFDTDTRSLDVSDVELLQVSCEGSYDAREQNIFRHNRRDHLRMKYNFHANVPRKFRGRLRQKMEYWAGHHRVSGSGAEADEEAEEGNGKPMSVFLLILDSTSRTSAFRHLPKTTELLTKKMGFVDFKGHHPRGEKSIINTLALLMGLQPKDFWGTYKTRLGEYWDTAPFIWNTFSRLNYITGFFEDLPFYGTFNFNQKGFLHKPTDFYTRPLMTAHNFLFPFDRNRICYGNRSVLPFMLEHQLEILRRLRDTPTFLVSWSAWPQHEFPPTLNLHDPPLHTFFTKIAQDQTILDNTLFIVTSDHGFAKYTYAKTAEGLLERRSLPLFIRLPDKFVSATNIKGKGQDGLDILNNLLKNSEGLTSHFDVYETLLDVARRVDEWGVVGEDDVGQGRSKHGRSLLQIISEGQERSCEEAHIVQTMCGCNLPHPNFQQQLQGNGSSQGTNENTNVLLAMNESQFEMKYQ